MKRNAIAHMQNMMANSVKNIAMEGITGKNETNMLSAIGWSLKSSSVFA